MAVKQSLSLKPQSQLHVSALIRPSSCCLQHENVLFGTTGMFYRYWLVDSEFNHIKLLTIISLYSKQLLVFVMEGHCVLCEV